MRINAINNIFCVNNHDKPHFKGLIKDKSALPILNSMSEFDKIEFRQIEERLAKTKYWDIKLSSVGNYFKEFKFHFINKKNKNVITDGIYPYDRNGNVIKFYSIVYGPENTSGNMIRTLKFKTKKRAEELYNKYRENVIYAINQGYKITPVESLKMKEMELRMLEEASDFFVHEHNVKKINTKEQTKQSIGNDLFKD